MTKVHVLPIVAESAVAQPAAPTRRPGSTNPADDGDSADPDGHEDAVDNADDGPKELEPIEGEIDGGLHLVVTLCSTRGISM